MLKDKAIEFFASNPDAKAVCVTSDGTVFNIENHTFADSHAQTLENPFIEIFAKDENDLDERLKRLFFEGSKWILRLIVETLVEKIEEKIEEKRASKPKKSRTE